MELAATGLAAIPARHPEAPLTTVGAILFAVWIVGLMVVLLWCYRQRRHLPLRRCPLCAADAVCAIESEAVDALQVHVRQQCGQCRAWRRNVTTHWTLGRHERMLEDDRTELRRRAEQLEHTTAPASRRTPR